MAEKASSTLSCSASQLRRTNKPLVERRRRERINKCLTELKSLVLESMKKDSSRYSKLEKADILEMTVKHLRSLQRTQLNAATSSDPSLATKFRAGYNECAGQITRYLSAVDGVNGDTKARIVGHLSGCVRRLEHEQSYHAPTNTLQQTMQPIKVEIPSSSPTMSLPESARVPSTHAQSAAYQTVANSAACMQVPVLPGGVAPVGMYPTLIQPGALAFILPQNNGQSHGLLQTAPTHPTVMLKSEPISPEKPSSPLHGFEAPSSGLFRNNQSNMQCVKGDFVYSQRDMWRPW